MPPDEQFVEKSVTSAYVGLIPAAGVGSRLPGRKLSKEMLPVGGHGGDAKPAMSHLINCMQRAGVSEIAVVIREGKQDISNYLAGREWQHIQFDNKYTRGTSGVPETVMLGIQDLEDRHIAFGFPDILFEPHDAYTKMMQRIEKSGADVVLGLFPTASPGKMDMVETDAGGKVTRIEIKPESTRLDLTWILATWKPTFSAYLGDLLRNDSARLNEGDGDTHLGHAFQLAMADGLQVAATSFPDGRSLDIGTPDDLERARSWPA